MKKNELNEQLIIACTVMNLKEIEILLNKGADINAKDKKGNTALHYTVHNKNVISSILLLDNGADINTKNNEGFSPLYYAKQLSIEKEIICAKTEINHNFMARVALYLSSHNYEEGLSLELFNETYGTAMGKHYFDKWFSTYKRNFMQIIAYFGRGSTDGQKFCDMVAGQMLRYEERVGL